MDVQKYLLSATYNSVCLVHVLFSRMLMDFMGVIFVWYGISLISFSKRKSVV